MTKKRGWEHEVTTDLMMNVYTGTVLLNFNLRQIKVDQDYQRGVYELRRRPDFEQFEAAFNEIVAAADQDIDQMAEAFYAYCKGRIVTALKDAKQLEQEWLAKPNEE